MTNVTQAAFKGKKVLFLNRTYNDFDIQTSLMSRIAAARPASVDVIGIICDGVEAEPYHHELSTYLSRRYGIRQTRISQAPGCPPLLKLTSAALALVRKLRFKSDLTYELLKPVDFVIRKTMKPLMRNLGGWTAELVDQWRDRVIIIDEVAHQTERSPIVDHVLPALAAAGTPIFVVKTGHHIYQADVPSISQVVVGKNRLKSQFFCVAGTIDEQLEPQRAPFADVRRYGNARMNPVWIEEAVAAVHAAPLRRPMPQAAPGKVRVVAMLSKVTYGVEVEALKQTLRLMANDPRVELVIKPHTRGMRFNFMSMSELPGVHLMANAPSTQLIEWCDLILFTGSSIAFHAMLRNKEVGYLKHVQKLGTIFDTADDICRILRSDQDLTDLIDKMSGEGVLEDQSEARQAFYHTELYGGSTDADVPGRLVRAMAEALAAPTGDRDETPTVTETA